MKKTVRVTIITVLIVAVGVVMMFVTPGTLMIGNRTYSNVYHDSPEDALRYYYKGEIELKESVYKIETDSTCLFLYFNGRTVNVCKMIKDKSGKKYCYYGDKIKFKYESEYIKFDKNCLIINDDTYYFDIVYENRKYLIDNDFETYDFTVKIEDTEEVRHLVFGYKIESN